MGSSFPGSKRGMACLGTEEDRDFQDNTVGTACVDSLQGMALPGSTQDMVSEGIPGDI